MGSEILVAQKPRLELDHGPTKMGLVSDFLYIFWYYDNEIQPFLE